MSELTHQCFAMVETANKKKKKEEEEEERRRRKKRKKKRRDLSTSFYRAFYRVLHE